MDEGGGAGEARKRGSMTITSYRFKPRAEFYTSSNMLQWVGCVCTKFGTVILTTWRNDAGNFEHHLQMYRPPFNHQAWAYGEKSERGLVLLANKFARLAAAAKGEKPK